MGGATVLGQAVLDLEQHKELYSGIKKRFKLPLAQCPYDVYDTTGTKMSLSVSSKRQPQGFLSVRVGIPSIYQNMCGKYSLHAYGNRHDMH